MEQNTQPIDYSRPVGWWCPVCHMQWAEYPNTLIRQHQHAIIPRYLPIPEGQRPLVDDEVEDAEVCTWDMGGNCCMSGDHSYTTTDPVTSWEVNYIVTGATE